MREYGWVAGFAVGYDAVIDERGVVRWSGERTPHRDSLLALAVLVYLIREVAISAARIDGWAEANFLSSGDSRLWGAASAAR